MKKIYYPNCSELIADFNTKRPEEFYRMVKKLGKKHDWYFDPPLTLVLLEKMKKMAMVVKLGGNVVVPGIMVLNTKGYHTSIEYGSNGYDNSLGFRFDSGCAHGDSSQYEFFAVAVANCLAEMKCYDGGSTQPFEKWLKRKS